MIIIIMVVITIITLIYAVRGDIDDDINCKKGTDNDGIKDNDDDNDDDNASSPERSIKLAHVPPWIPCMMMIMCVVMMKRDLTPMTFVVVFTRSVRLLLCLRAGCVCAQLVFVVVFAHRAAQNRSEYAILKQRAAVIGVVVMETHCRCNSGESTSNSNKSRPEVKFKWDSSDSSKTAARRSKDKF